MPSMAALVLQLREIERTARSLQDATKDRGRRRAAEAPPPLFAPLRLRRRRSSPENLPPAKLCCGTVELRRTVNSFSASAVAAPGVLQRPSLFVFLTCDLALSPATAVYSVLRRSSETPSVSFGEASTNQHSDRLEAELARMESSSNVPEADTGKGQEASSSGQGSGVDLSSVTRGAWKGSDVKQPEIDWLYRSRRVPAGVICRLPRGEVEPNPEPGEHVVFLAHFERGFGLPASDFFRSFLDFYELQPHHLPGNAVFYLSCYATFMEAYMGLRSLTRDPRFSS
ncbi:hypothetical protein QYE76_009191 [Lolium multiflorum]|uniref:Transposase (putative) gypsy type domain-containing protein n=1 Tax=Lolium multiflorum TaxID=4521 RepID=A0AAD8X3C7_LOLMU|nr:hypothetical protein QYE76_009191 [Lolium multiflorum]